MKTPKKPSGRRALPFYWWRRFSTHKCLPTKSSTLNKIRHGDFEYPDFFQQAEWELHWMKDEQKEFVKNYKGRQPLHDKDYIDIELRARKRYNKLFEDGRKEEFTRMEKLVSSLRKTFKIDKEKIEVIMETFDGNTEELYFYIAEKLGYNIDTLNKLNDIKVKR